MQGVTRVTANGQVYAIFCKGTSPVKGVEFVTQPEDEFQVGLMDRPSGDHVQPHAHPETARTVHRTSEFLFVSSGKMRVRVFGDDWALLAEEILVTGDCLVFFRGGHEVEMLEPTKLVEVKQGPFIEGAPYKTFRGK